MKSLRTAILLASAVMPFAMPSLASAQDYLFGGQGAVPQNSQVQTNGQTVQIRMPTGVVVSFVGDSAFTVEGSSLNIARGGVTVAGSGGAPLSLTLPGGRNATIAGAGSLTVGANGTRGQVMGGQMTIDGRAFTAGQSFAAALNGAVRQAFANAAQAAPPATATLVDAAISGLPVTLGEALAAAGASADVLAAAMRVDSLAAVDIGTQAVPGGDLSLLLDYYDRLGFTLTGANSDIVSLYLAYLGSGGELAAFQSAYVALLSQYFQLLASGGVVGDFGGLDPSAVQTYLAYLTSIGGLDQLGDQAPIIEAYLDFLAGGGNPADFIVAGNLLSEEVIAAYVAAIQAYVSYFAANGDISDYAGLSTDILVRYLTALEASGLLDTLLASQAEVLRDYLAFLQDGGNPSDFTGFRPAPTPTPTPTPNPGGAGTIANQTVVYAGNAFGIDTRYPATVTYDDQGAPISYLWDLSDFTRGNESPSLGAATTHESGSVANVIGWTRWAGGALGGNYYGHPVSVPANGGIHIVSGNAATNMPTSGTVSYSLVGATAPTIDDGSLAPGSFAGELAVAFGSTPRVGFELDVTIGGSTYAINSPGGVGDPMQGAAVNVEAGRFYATWGLNQLTVSGGGSLCASSCTANVQGFLAGDGASHVGLAYNFAPSGSNNRVAGAAVFGK